MSIGELRRLEYRDAGEVCRIIDSLVTEKLRPRSVWRRGQILGWTL